MSEQTKTYQKINMPLEVSIMKETEKPLTLVNEATKKEQKVNQLCKLQLDKNNYENLLNTLKSELEKRKENHKEKEEKKFEEHKKEVKDLLQKDNNQYGETWQKTYDQGEILKKFQENTDKIFEELNNHDPKNRNDVQKYKDGIAKIRHEITNADQAMRRLKGSTLDGDILKKFSDAVNRLQNGKVNETDQQFATINLASQDIQGQLFTSGLMSSKLNGKEGKLLSVNVVKKEYTVEYDSNKKIIIKQSDVCLMK